MNPYPGLKSFQTKPAPAPAEQPVGGESVGGGPAPSISSGSPAPSMPGATAPAPVVGKPTTNPDFGPNFQNADPDYVNWYNSLAPSTRQYVAAPGSQTLTYQQQQEQQSNAAFNSKDPWNMALGQNTVAAPSTGAAPSNYGGKPAPAPPPASTTPSGNAPYAGAPASDSPYTNVTFKSAPAAAPAAAPAQPAGTYANPPATPTLPGVVGNSFYNPNVGNGGGRQVAKNPYYAGASGNPVVQAMMQNNLLRRRRGY